METTFSVNIFRHFYDVLISTKTKTISNITELFKGKNMFSMYIKFNFLPLGWGDTGMLIRFENIVNRYEIW